MEQKPQMLTIEIKVGFSAIVDQNLSQRENIEKLIEEANKELAGADIIITADDVVKIEFEDIEVIDSLDDFIEEAQQERKNRFTVIDGGKS